MREFPIRDLRPHSDAHPALAAWFELYPDSPDPGGIISLKEHKGLKGSVYQIGCVGPDRSAVIAKRCGSGRAQFEYEIYTQILAHAPNPCVRCYGYLEEPDGSYAWLFLEDVGSIRYSRFDAEHRALKARWAAQLHAFAAESPAAGRLPDRGPNWYLADLRRTREIILNHRDDPDLRREGGAALDRIVAHCDLLESHWDELEAFCAQWPSTLVHGDLVSKNLRVRGTPSGHDLLVFDWEHAGWAIPAADICEVDFDTYRLTIRKYWTVAQDHSLECLSNTGTLFRLLAACHWASEYLPYPDIRRGAIISLHMYGEQIYNTIYRNLFPIHV